MLENTTTKNEILNKISNLLHEKSIQFKSLHHKATFTSEESAQERNEDLSIGGKAILMKLDDSFRLFVLSASKKLDNKKLKQKFNSKKIRFATIDELKELTGGLVPGSVPPFGRPILEFDLFVDESILKNEKIAFNAGSLTDSIVMDVKDYLIAASPIVFDFSSS